MAKLLIYQIVYGNNQRTEFTPFVNNSKQKLWRFEWNPMLEICGNADWLPIPENGYLGIFSWKFQEKSGLTRDKITALLSSSISELEANIDVFTACKPIQHNGYPSFMQWSEEGHKGIIYLLERCLWNIGAKYYHEPKHVVYANQFIATKAVYLDFINNWAKPSLELLEGELWPIVNKDAGYQAGLPKRELKRLTGLDFYNYLPFVMERLFSQYLANNPELKVKSLL